MKQLNLLSISLPLRSLFTGYLVVSAVGLAMAAVQILLTHGMADGEFGLSVNDIVYSYYGNRENSRLEEKLNGTMKDKASSHDRALIVKWVRDGAKEDEWNGGIQQVFADNCVKCHGVIPGLPDFRQIEGVRPVAKISEGATIQALARVSHVHLFGIAFIFFFICLIFSLAVGIDPRIKAVAIALPFAFLLVDILSWWLTKWFPAFAYLEIVAGIGSNLAAAFMISTSIYQMWFMSRFSVKAEEDVWSQ